MAGDGISLIPFADRAAWERATAQAMPSQRWGHAAGLASAGYAPELAVVKAQGATLLLPFHRRQFARGGAVAVDIATLPGLSGASISPPSPAPLAAWSDFARAQGWVAGYLQLGVDNAEMAIPPPDRRVARNALFLFDLADWRLETSVGHNMRKALRRANRDGAFLVTDQARLAKAFPAMHAQALQDLGSAPQFGPAAFAAWSASNDIRFFGGEVAGALQIVVMCLCANGQAEGYLAGATPQGRSLHGWIFWQSAEWFAQAGCTRYNIGGYGEEGDGLHLMKQRLTSRSVPLASVRQVYDQARFDQLCAQTGADPASGYFPPYRDPGLLAAGHLGSGADQA